MCWYTFLYLGALFLGFMAFVLIATYSTSVLFALFIGILVVWLLGAKIRESAIEASWRDYYSRHPEAYYD